MKMFRNVSSHLIDVRRHFRFFDIDQRIDIDDLIAVFFQHLIRLIQQKQRRDAFVSGIRVRKMRADILEAHGADQRFDDRMQQYIGIGMAQETFFIRDLHTADDQISSFYQFVNIF